jgi:hypothetical protein
MNNAVIKHLPLNNFPDDTKKGSFENTKKMKHQNLSSHLQTAEAS